MEKRLNDGFVSKGGVGGRAEIDSKKRLHEKGGGLLIGRPFSGFNVTFSDPYDVLNDPELLMFFKKPLPACQSGKKDEPGSEQDQCSRFGDLDFR